MSFARMRARAGRASFVVGLAAIAAAVAAAPTSDADLAQGEPAPTVSAVHGTALWAPVGSELSYRVAVSNAPRSSSDRVTSYLTVARAQGASQSYTPSLAPGAVAYVGVSADGGRLWSPQEAVVRAPGAEPTPGAGQTAEGLLQQPSLGAYPVGTVEAAAEAAEAEPESPARPASAFALAVTGAIIGTNDGSGWGPLAAAKIVAGHITWDRFSTKAWSQGVLTSQNYGFNVLGILNAVNDRTPLSQIEPNAWGQQAAAELAAHPSMTLAEAGNESYLKGNVANPVQYGRMYMAAIKAIKARGFNVRLLFNMTGDYPRGTWSVPGSWSEDARGGGWLRDAVNGVPGLAAAILANGVSIHPYGAVGENKHDDYGVSAAAADEAVAGQVLGSIPRFYITEFGYSLSACGRDLGACTPKEQAEKARAAYNVLLSDPHVYGIWWYQSHDDSTGRFGYMSNLNMKRPAFAVLASFAKAEGQ
jgi:hypothetical protein